MTNNELQKLVAIAKEKIVEMERRENLETQYSNEADYLDIAIWELKSALIAAYELGKQSSATHRMTKFEKDLEDAINGNSVEVLTARKAELERIEKEGRACRNEFRRLCLAQEYARLKAEYVEIDSHF